MKDWEDIDIMVLAGEMAVIKAWPALVVNFSRRNPMAMSHSPPKGTHSPPLKGTHSIGEPGKPGSPLCLSGVTRGEWHQLGFTQLARRELNILQDTKRRFKTE